jgi:peptide/nickel transport system substrate-binding protein
VAGTPGSTRPSPSRRWRIAVLAASLAAVTAAAGCSSSKSSASGSSTAAKDVAFGTIGAPPTLNPATGDPAYGSLYQWAYDPLVVMKGDGSFAPGLATKWGYVGDGNTSYELTLRDGVKFSDGTAMDAQAVKTFLDYERSQKTGSISQLLVSVGSIDVTGPLTVRLTLTKPDPNLTFNFAQAFGAGDIASPKAVANPSTLDAGTAGAGPYMLDASQTVANDHYTFVQNPNYWDKGRQHFQTVTVRVIANPSSMVQAVQAGQIQAALGDATTLQAARSAGLTVIAPQQALVGLNLVDRGGQLAKPLGDVRVRQALNLAVDRSAIAQALYGDKKLALSQYALDGQAAYDDTLNGKAAYDVAKAKQLLSEAGYQNGFDLPVLSLSPASGDKVIQAIAGQLGKIGVTLKITSKATIPDYVTTMLSGQFPATFIGYGLANMGSLYAGFVNPQGPFNPFHTVDPQLDALYQQYNVANPQDSGKAQQQINGYLVDQAWAVPVVGAPLSYYLAKGYTGLDATSANAGVPWLTDLRPAG